MIEGFWLGVGFWLATEAFFVFIVVVTMLTSLVLGILDAVKEIGRKGKDDR
jgi:hypothetical protein